MANIDERLLDPEGEPELAENFNRVLAIVDAIEQALTVTVSFDSDGGTAVNTQTIAYKGKATEPTTPTKTGYTFDGWYLGTDEFDFTAEVVKPITLKAHWVAE